MKKRKLLEKTTVGYKKPIVDFKFEDFDRTINKTTSELLYHQILWKTKNSKHFSLPPEILNLIFEYSTKQDKDMASFVCSDWFLSILTTRIQLYKNVIKTQNVQLQNRIESKRREINIAKIRKIIKIQEKEFEKWNEWQTKFSFEDLQEELLKRRLKTKGTKQKLQTRLEESLPKDLLESISTNIRNLHKKIEDLNSPKEIDKERNTFFEYLPPSSIYSQRRENCSIHVVSTNSFNLSPEQKDMFSTISFHSSIYDAYTKSSDFDVILLSPSTYSIDFPILKSIEFIGNCANPLDVIIKVTSLSIHLAQVKFINIALHSDGNNLSISTNFMNLKDFSSVEFNYCDISMENSFEFSMSPNSQLIVQHSFIHDSLRGFVHLLPLGAHLILDNCLFNHMRLEKDQTSNNSCLILINCLNEKLIDSTNHIKIRSCQFNNISEPTISIMTFGGSNEQENSFNIEKDEKYEKNFKNIEKSIHCLNVNISHIKIVESTFQINPPTKISPTMIKNDHICDCGFKFNEINPENENIRLWICQNYKCINGFLKKQIFITKSSNDENSKSCSYWFCRSQGYEISLDFLKRIEPNLDLNQFDFEKNVYEIRLCENGHIKCFLNDEEEEE
eukprot:gene10652-3276_t